MALVSEVIRPAHYPLVEFRPGHTVDCVGLMAAPLGFETHYLGRSFLCGGSGCSACQHRSKRWLGFMAVRVGHSVKLLELTAPAWQSGYARLRFEKWPDALGVGWRLTKASVRAPIRMEPMKQFAAEERPEVVATSLLTVARLFRLPLPLPNESPSAWDERVSEARIGIARAAVLSVIGPGALRS